MKFKDTCDITLKLIDKIDNLWSLFFASNLGIAIWIISDENNINSFLTVLTSLAYIAYSLIQFFALVRGYKFLEFAITELKLHANDKNLKSKKLKNGIISMKYKGRIAMVIISYIITIAIILFLLWTDCDFS